MRIGVALFDPLYAARCEPHVSARRTAGNITCSVCSHPLRAAATNCNRPGDGAGLHLRPRVSRASTSIRHQGRGDKGCTQEATAVFETDFRRRPTGGKEKSEPAGSSAETAHPPPGRFAQDGRRKRACVDVARAAGAAQSRGCAISGMAWGPGAKQGRW